MSGWYGEWNSPLSAAEAARAGARFGNVHLGDGHVMWTESIPSEGGRMSIRFAELIGCSPTEAQEFRPGRLISARSRINEYGGGSFWRGGPGDLLTFWVDAETQCIHSAERDGPLHVLTPSPGKVRAWRYGAGVITPDGAWMVTEREVHPSLGSPLDERDVAGEAVNDMVAVRVGGLEVIALIGPDQNGGGDFVAAPAMSPDGSALAWLRWDHPDMPWDAAELWAGEFGVVDGVPQISDSRRVAGGRADSRSPQANRAVAVCLPVWSPSGELWWCDDADEWWHLRRANEPGVPAEGAGETCPLVMDYRPEEVGEPRWVSGGCRYGFTSTGKLVFVASSGGLDGLWTMDLETGERERTPGPRFSYVESISVSGRCVAVIAGTPTQPTSIWVIDPDEGTAVDVRAVSAPVGAEWISEPEPISFETSGNDICHGLLYRPKGAVDVTDPRELPPLVVRIHGGPTASARSEYSTSVQFWTSRGFAVVDVNYRGSTGYGRTYRDKLNGEWGVVDVADCLAAARYLAEAGIVDGTRCVIRGGSSGGFTSLAAICFQAEWGYGDVIAAACSLYGVTDLASLARDTHKFESRYLDGLVGEYPREAELYASRSPLHNADKLDKPVLILQGSEDRIVPPSQAEVLIDALDANDVPHAYVLFAGEGHGFVNGDSIQRALEAELSFYGKVLGFTPAGNIAQVEFC